MSVEDPKQPDAAVSHREAPAFHDVKRDESAVYVDAVLYTREVERSRRLRHQIIWMHGVVFGILLALWFLERRN
jgi:hypothetical protein